MALHDEIENGAREIATDGYAISIGEIINIYKDGELDLHPEFQRFFRWKQAQKSKLIESILLGIPLPSIFVFQRTDGVWDVIDGLQRLSTILEFAGELKEEDGAKKPQLPLTKTRYLPSLEGKYWNSPDATNSFGDAERRMIKRAKIDVKIIKSDSSETSKFELFQRLNTGGSIASDQEVRNCLLIMNNREMFKWIEELAQNADFQLCTALTSRQLEERYDLELILRFMILKGLREDQLAFEDVGDFLTDQMLNIASLTSHFSQRSSKEAFENTFRALVASGLEDDSFRKYDANKGRFLGSFSISGFEAVAVGLGSRFEQSNSPVNGERLIEAIKQIWGTREFTEYSGSGVRASSRIPHIVPLGRRIIANL